MIAIFLTNTQTHTPRKSVNISQQKTQASRQSDHPGTLMFVGCEKGGGHDSNAKIPPTDAPHYRANQDVILLTRTSLQRAERMKT